MRHSDLVSAISEYTDRLAKLDRFVQIDADHVGVIHVRLFTERLTEAPTPKAMLDVYEKHVLGASDNEDGKPSIEWECVDLDMLPAATLARVAQFKHHLELWHRNEMSDLPVTDAPDITNVNERAQRRSLLRRRR